MPCLTEAMDDIDRLVMEVNRVVNDNPDGSHVYIWPVAPWATIDTYTTRGWSLGVPIDMWFSNGYNKRRLWCEHVLRDD